MRFVPIYLDVLHAAERGEAARAAARRAMYARPDADPLPALEPVHGGSRLRARIRSLLATVGLTAGRDRTEAPDAV
ncbi:MAG TPA: hypothetical protein VFO73_12180 [Candidatus Limnocylindrales bacterium]|nr:hypothetical protein [Candidatus Limnocylindrales bacterium]HET9521799.1 hypothetical protein [Candidatus Limnocylindrales bacterium]